MKKVTYEYPKSSFLSMDKDMGLIVEKIMKNQNLQKLLHYTTKDCLNQPALSEDEVIGLFGKNIKIVPKMQIDESVLNYLIISFDNFAPTSNPEFRDNLVEFDVICHFDQWQLQDFQLRPYRIAAEIDSMFSDRKLTGNGELKFLGASQIVLTDEFAGICLIYQAIHGEEDKKNPLNPNNEENLVENFDKIFNDNIG